MSDIGAPPAAGGVVAVAAGATAMALGQVTLSQLPERLSLLTRPVLLSGTVTAQGADGTTVLRTQAGTVAFNTATPLSAETPVTLQISAGQPPTTANAFVMATPSATAAGSAGSATVAGAVAATLPLPAAAAGSAVTTTLGALAQAALSGADAGGDRASSSLVPGTVIPGQVLPPPAGRPGPASVSAPMPASSPVSDSPVVGSPALVAGTTVAVRILSTMTAPVAGSAAGSPGPSGAPQPPGPGAAPVVPPGSVDAAPVPVQLPAGRVMVPVVVTGTITGTTAGGQPILTTPLGTLALSTPAALAPGKTLTVQLSDPRPLFADRPSPAVPGPGAQAWPPLREAMAIVTGQEGGLAQAVFAATLPQPNRRLAAALTFALDAVRRGDARGWLGAESTAALEKAGRHDLLARLDKDFRTLAHEAADTPPGGWRPLAVPMLDGGIIQRVELFVRAVEGDGREGRDGGTGERHQRFLVDLDLSRLGALQLDGLVRSKSKRFDLILRSLNPLPDPLRAELLGVFGNSLEAVGYVGTFGFQTGARGWVKPAPSGRATGRPAVIA